MRANLVVLIVAFLVLALVFGVIERLWPAVRGVSIWRRERRIDFVYWLFTPVVTRWVSMVSLAIVIALLAAVLGAPRKAELFAEWVQARSPVSRIPALPQFALALLISDFFGYWSHRLFHGRALWRFHAIHHSAEQLDWLAATRVHPVNDVLAKFAVALPLLLLGFDLRIFAATAPVLAFWAIFVHANVPWGLGPLRYVVVTPLFHRWHHTSEDEGLDKNFAGLFPFYDLIFGTLYLPAGRQPERFGVTRERVPAGFFGQLWYPFGPKR